MLNSVIFDMDGVLFDTEKIYDKAWMMTARKFGLKNLEELICNFRGTTVSDVKKIIDKSYNDTVLSEKCIKYFRKKCTETIIMHGLPLKPGVREILKYLKESNFRIALATSNSRKVTKLFLMMSRLANYFDTIITGDMVEKGKPAPDIYVRACMEIGRSPEECIVIEDSFNGIKAAYSAKIKVVMVPDQVMPTAEINKLLFTTCESLFGVKNIIEENINEIKTLMINHN